MTVKCQSEWPATAATLCCPVITADLWPPRSWRETGRRRRGTSRATSPRRSSQCWWWCRRGQRRSRRRRLNRRGKKVRAADRQSPRSSMSVELTYTARPKFIMRTKYIIYLVKIFLQQTVNLIVVTQKGLATTIWTNTNSSPAVP